MEEDAGLFLAWLALFGREEYKGLSEIVPAIPQYLLESSCQEAFTDVQPPLTRIIRLMWLIRSDLRERFDIAERNGQEGLVWWYYTQGAVEHDLLDRISQDEARVLNRVVPSRKKGLFSLTRFMQKLWEARSDLQSEFDISTQKGRDSFILWLVLQGVSELNLDKAPIELPPSLLKPAETALPGVRPPLTRLMHLVWKYRLNLQKAYDLDTEEGQQEYIWWYFTQGGAEYGLARFSTEKQKEMLAEPADGFPQDDPLPINRLMFKVWERWPDLRNAFDLNTAQGRARFTARYYSRGLVKLKLAPTLTASQRSVLLQPEDADSSTPRILSWIWRESKALQERFPDPGSSAYLQWAMDEGLREYPILAELPDLVSALRPEVEIQRGSVIAKRSADWKHRPLGVNLIGYPRGQLGIGEDIRMAALALRSAEIPFSIYAVEPGSDVCQADESLSSHVSDDLQYSINLICMTGIETARLAAVEGRHLFGGRYTIGYWPWELPDWPEEWRHAYGLVDEVWASSRYTYEAYRRSCSKPVRHMSMAIAVEPASGLTRKHFGLPEDRFLFVFSFDMLSSIDRKNPEACIRAFLAAFPKGSEPVGLIVKAMRACSENPRWQSLVAEAKRDPRIKLVDGTLDRSVLHDFYRACNCYLSLHRSEGFGRGMAEAMLLGKPVIATGYSGNMDFTVPGTAMLVDHRLRPVNAGEYPFGEGQLWAEPDIEHAAWCMRRIVSSSALRVQLARTGLHLVNSAYSPAHVGAAYAQVLSQRLNFAKRAIQ
ncbi:glycosyltransferase family 4 protein [Thiorhodococcus fuscus]|uniref:Glycosyltransferase family 4 protein n=1 Tax=Thiorhodococcus fuscus TaxID=527200 RepID=A0ABW4YE63_9GAMM